MLSAKCDQCKSSFQADDKFAGKRARCPKCGSVIVVASAQRVAAATPATAADSYRETADVAAPGRYWSWAVTSEQHAMQLVRQCSNWFLALGGIMLALAVIGLANPRIIASVYAEKPELAKEGEAIPFAFYVLAFGEISFWAIGRILPALWLRWRPSVVAASILVGLQALQTLIAWISPIWSEGTGTSSGQMVIAPMLLHIAIRGFRGARYLARCDQTVVMPTHLSARVAANAAANEVLGAHALKGPLRATLSRSIALFLKPRAFAVIVGVGSGMLLSWLWLSVPVGEWTPVGDGRTIVNTRTGELRVASTGESVENYRARIAAEGKQDAAQEAEERKAREKESQDLLARLASERSRRDERDRLQRHAQLVQQHRREVEERLARETERQAEENKLQAALIENGRHFHAVQVAAFTLAPESGYISTQWRGLTSGVRADRFISKDKRDELAWVIADALRGGEVSGQDWAEMYDHLQALRYDLRGQMIRSPDQLKESRSRILGAP